jgi:GDP-L-fucose synthase
MNSKPKIYVAGHRGMVGSVIVRALQQKGQTNMVTRTHAELDLTSQAAVRGFFEAEKPAQVYLAAAKVGGIHANNTYPAEFIYQNLDDAGQRHPRSLARWRAKALVPRLQLHLPQAGAPAHA